MIINLIANTDAGLTVRAQLDETAYPTGVKVSDNELATLDIERFDFHGEWNYTIYQRNQP